MAYIDDFRALASIAISKDIAQGTKDKAELLLVKIMDVIEKSIQIEDIQATEFLEKINSRIEVVKG